MSSIEFLRSTAGSKRQTKKSGDALRRSWTDEVENTGRTGLRPVSVPFQARTRTALATR